MHNAPAQFLGPYHAQRHLYSFKFLCPFYKIQIALQLCRFSLSAVRNFFMDFGGVDIGPHVSIVIHQKMKVIFIGICGLRQTDPPQQPFINTHNHHSNILRGLFIIDQAVSDMEQIILLICKRRRILGRQNLYLIICGQLPIKLFQRHIIFIHPRCLVRRRHKHIIIDDFPCFGNNRNRFYIILCKKYAVQLPAELASCDRRILSAIDIFHKLNHIFIRIELEKNVLIGIQPHLQAVLRLL